MTKLSFRAKGWLEKDGKVVAGGGKIQLLEYVQSEGSISSAAKAMNMSYRHAWGIVKDMEKAAGGKLVESSRGGSSGGKTGLTALGMKLIKEYHAGEKKLKESGF